MIKLTLIRSDGDEVEWWLKPAHISDIMAHQGGSKIFTILGGLNQSCVVAEKPSEVIKRIIGHFDVKICGDFSHKETPDYRSVAHRDE